MQSSRRAFLLGRRPERAPWEAFCEGLRAVIVGELRQRRLILGHPQDVWRARELAAHYGIVLGLWGLAGPPEGLWLDPCALRAWREEDGALVAASGCPVGELARAGLPQFRQADPQQSVAVWLASATDYARPADSGLNAVTVMFADGVVESLGPFGLAGSQPLRSGTTQRLVPALFRLAAGTDAAGQRWPARFRLDALRQPANLAQVLLGHGGALAWVQESRWRPGLPADSPLSLSVEGERVDQQVKALFDAQGRFICAQGHPKHPS
ncbi:hypothetical protein ACLQ9F_15130 [Bordetella avium]|uniref:hypothetical protein n=1 Tax=Bordetella avium TaxID=521 RepID=UPI000E69D372|nr:hypothetical protein [Bordetella avium]AZY51765.1 hypothetical protein C0J07_04040 [Bordetella avium]RIQ16000.1 hypothetical protein D0850_16600 [Bordetella avium]RIQ30219.1 hypothetical protein D0849_15955 [Bordetella avium]